MEVASEARCSAESGDRAIGFQSRGDILSGVGHSFWVPSLHGKVDLIPGRSNFIRIEACKPGDYEGQCAEYCGAQHAHMRLLVVAQNPDEFDRWSQQQRKPALQPTSGDAAAGQDVFLKGACAMCHEIRGTQAGGTVAPDLTHIAAAV